MIKGLNPEEVKQRIQNGQINKSNIKTEKSIKDITGILISQNTLLSSNSNSFQKLKNFSFKKKLNNKKDRKRLSKKYFNY